MFSLVCHSFPFPRQGFNAEDMFAVTRVNGGEKTQGPKVEELMCKLRRLQQGKKALDAEIEELESVSDSLQKELATLKVEARQLEGLHKEKEELSRKLQLQCEESVHDSDRQFEQKKKSDELLERYKCEIQELKLKHRKQRMKFENQLHQLIEQHKSLHSIFTPQRLPDEIESAENTKSQLLSTEELKLAELKRLDEEIEDARKQQQLRTAADETQEQ